MSSESHSHPMKIGLCLPNEEDEQGLYSYANIRDFALQAEALGFDSLWLSDHLLFRFPSQPTQGVWEAWSLLSALAEATQRPELGTLVTCTPFRNPALLAKMANAVEEISGGRLILGLGAGWHQPEFDAFGYPFDHKASRFEEALHIITSLLRQGQVDFQGQYHQARECALLPRGPRPGGPPILVAAFKPRLLRLAARYADLWNTAWLGTPTLLAERRLSMEEACRLEGRDPATLGVTVGVMVLAPELQAEATDPEKTLSGSPEEVAAGLLAHQAQGVEHAMLWLRPFNGKSLSWLGHALRIFREH